MIYLFIIRLDTSQSMLIPSPYCHYLINKQILLRIERNLKLFYAQLSLYPLSLFFFGFKCRWHMCTLTCHIAVNNHMKNNFLFNKKVTWIIFNRKRHLLYEDSRVDSTTYISLTIFTRQRLPSDIYTLFSFFYLSDISLGLIFIFLLFIIQI